MPVMERSPEDAPYWTDADDGWSYYVKPSSFEHRQGQWYAVVQRARDDEVNHHSSWFPTEQEAQDWCVAYIQEHHAVLILSPRP